MEAFKPHLRKNIDVGPYEYLFLYTCIYFVATFVLLCNKNQRSLWNIFHSSPTDYILIVGVALGTAYSIGLFYEIEKDMHASSYNAIRISVTLMSTFFIGRVFYDEKIEPTHVLGLFLIILGISIMTFAQAE